MPQTLATPIAFEFVQSKLIADATLMALGTPPLSQGTVANPGPRVYQDEIPQGGLYPAIVVSMLAAVPRKGVGNVTIWSNVLLLVKAIGEGRSMVQPAAIMNRVDAVLQAAYGQVSSGEVFATMSEDEVVYLEAADGGVRYMHVGRRWRLLAV